MSPEVLTGELELSEVSKVTSVARKATAGPDSARPEGEYYNAVEPNSFGLPSVTTCPGRTAVCEQDCYAIESERRHATYIKLQRNLDVIQACADEAEITDKIDSLVDGYRSAADKLGIPQNERFFRIHWSGDFDSEPYARAWRTIIEKNSDTRFLVYTHSFLPNMNVVPILAGIKNLDLFISVDCQNVERAAEVLAEYPDLRVAYLVEYYEDVFDLIDKLDRGKGAGFRQLACPENMRKENGERKLSVISERGGACARCTYCVGKPDSWDVVFVKSGLTRRSQLELPFMDEVAVNFIKKRPKTNYDLFQPLGATAVAEPQAALF